jgi:hypothetical protein
MDVDMSVPLWVLDHVSGNDVRLLLVKDADHRFSELENLAMIRRAVHSVTMKAAS